MYNHYSGVGGECQHLIYETKEPTAMTKQEIRTELKERHIPQWKLGDLLGVSENTINRKLRKELTTAEKERILDVIRTGERYDER